MRIALTTGLPLDPLGEDHSGSPQQRIGAICEGRSVHRDETFRGALQTRWRLKVPSCWAVVMRRQEGRSNSHQPLPSMTCILSSAC